MSDIVDSGSGEGLTIDSIFESLSRSGDKDEKPDAKDEKIDNDEDSDEELIPLKDKEEADEEESDDDSIEDDEDEEDEENDDEDREEDEKESDEEDELELAKIPTRAQIKAKYPNIFKEFKALDRIFYREKEFAEVFPTVKDAKVAKVELGDYAKIQDELLSGDVTGVLNRVKTTNPKAFEKIANSIIEQLIKVDKDSYIEPARVVFKSGLNNLYAIASAALKKDPNNKRAEQMQIAAEMVHEGLFGTSEVTPYERQVKEEDKENPEVVRLQQERAKLDNDRLNEAGTKVSSRLDNRVTRTLEKNIDPKNVLTPYVKNNLIKDIKNELDRQLIADKRFGAVIKKLYERAKESNYSQASLDNINTALENKAASILPDIMRAKKGEALRGSSNVRKMKTRELSRDNEKSENATTRSSRSDSEKRSLTRNERRESDSPRPDESALDYLNRKLG